VKLRDLDNNKFLSSTLLESLKILPQRDRNKIFLVILLQVFLALLDLAGVAIIGVLGSLAVSGVQGQKPGDKISFFLRMAHLQDSSLQAQFTVLGLTATVLLISKTIFTVYFTRKILFFLSRRGADVSGKLVTSFLRQPLLEIQSQPQQSVLYSLTNGVGVVMLGIVGATVNIISDVILLLILGAGLFVIDPVVASATLVVFSLVAYILYRLMHERAKILGLKAVDLTVQSNEKILEVLNSYREMVVRNRSDYYASSISADRMGLAESSAETAFLPSVSKYVFETVIVLGTLALGAAQFALQDARHAVGILAVFMAASARIAPAVLRVQTGLIQIKNSTATASGTLALIKRIGLEEVPSKRYSPLDLNHDGFVPKLAVSDLNFTYPGSNRKVIDNVTFDVSEGELVAIVGPSGAGKTTLVDVLLGLIHPDSGQILISDSLPEAVVKKWPGAISYVPQEVLITNTSMRQNVILGYEENEVDDENVWDALKLAQLEQLASEFPNKLDAIVGEKGSSLSGGQRQRLGIARSLFTKPKLIVFDEATSSLDGQTESDLSDAILGLKGKVTVIMIAHRLSTVRSADRVLYLSEGRLVCSGTFDEVRNAVPDFDRQAKLMGL
jgi:ABC-type multidrug transport system fused ATPase/permease subunit